MSKDRFVWVWDSPDGPIFFSSAKKGMAYVDRLLGPAVWSEEMREGRVVEWVRLGAGVDDDLIGIRRELLL